MLMLYWQWIASTKYISYIAIPNFYFLFRLFTTPSINSESILQRDLAREEDLHEFHENNML